MNTLAQDILRGASAISEFLYGDPGERERVYREADRGGIPHWREGSIICSRRSSLLTHIHNMEQAGLAQGRKAGGS